MDKNMMIWKLAPYLSVDEAMNLILNVLPGTYKFDFTLDKNKPKKGISIY